MTGGDLSDAPQHHQRSFDDRDRDRDRDRQRDRDLDTRDRERDRGRLSIPLSVVLPVNLAAGFLYAVASWYAGYALLGKAVADSTAANQQLATTINDKVFPRLSVVESENHDQRKAIDDLQRDMGIATGKIEGMKQTTFEQFSSLQVAIARIETELRLMTRASELTLPGDPKKP